MGGDHDLGRLAQHVQDVARAIDRALCVPWPITPGPGSRALVGALDALQRSMIRASDRLARAAAAHRAFGGLSGATTGTDDVPGAGHDQA